MALVTWGCYMLLDNSPNITMVRNWLREHTLQGPSSHVHSNGEYKRDIVRPADVVTDIKDTIVCPNQQEVGNVH